MTCIAFRCASRAVSLLPAIVITAGVLLVGCGGGGKGATAAPAITSLSTTSGPVGTPVTITGSNFGSSQGSSTVTFNGVSAGTASAWSGTSITINVPSGATTGGVVVTVGGQASNSVSFTVTIPAPAIASLNPTSGAIGSSVTIAGSNFGASQGSSTVTFNGVSAGTASTWSASSITVSVPIGATTGSVVVSVGGQASNGVTFTITASSANTVSGTAALGAPIANAPVTLVDAEGNSSTAMTGSDGSFTLNTGGFTPPFLVKIVTASASGSYPVGTTLYSVSTDGNATTHINIHVLSDLMVRSWYSTQGVDVDDAFASPASASNAAPSPSSVEILANAVIQPMRLWFGKARITITPGTPANSFINLISSSFSANGTGLDSALDSISSETLNSSTGVVSQVTVTGGTVTETITPDYSAGSMTLNTSTTDSSTGAVTTGSESTLLPASSAQQAAINSINSALSNFQSTVNAKGSALSGSDLLPYFASDYLNDGLNSSQDSAALAGDFAGLTMSGLQVTAIKSLDTTNNLADVILAITLSLGAQSETLIQEEIFKQESGSWLLYGDQRIASVTVTAESRASQGGSSISPGVAHQVDLSTEVMAPHGVVQSATVSGGGNIWNGTASGTLYDEAQILQNGIALDDFILLSQGLTSPFPAQGTQFTFNLTTVSSGNQQYQVPLSNGFTTETIEFSGISSTSGSGPLSSVVGKTLTYSWPLPTTYAATQVSFFAYIYDGPATTSTTHSCEIHYDSLSAAQTSGTITIPANMSACGLSASDAIQQVNLFLNITGADGENNITAIVYPY